MKVNKSTQACEGYNTINKASIEGGLMEAWEPNDDILRQEANARATAANQEKFRELCAQFWRLVISQLSAADAEVYSGAKQNTSLNHSDKEYPATSSASKKSLRWPSRLNLWRQSEHQGIRQEAFGSHRHCSQGARGEDHGG